MKGCLKAVVFAAVLLVLAASAQASESDWRIAVRADNGAGEYSAPQSHFGVHPDSNDGVDTSGAVQDFEAPYTIDYPETLTWAVGYIPGDTRTWSKDIMSPSPAPVKRWLIRVAAGHNSPAGAIRLSFYTLGTSSLPPQTVGGTPVIYRLVLTDNKGMAGAPANGTIWNVPAPTEHSANPYYTVPDTLPAIKLPAYTHQDMIDYGYQLELQQVVPEPSGVAALGMGLTALVGLAIRKRGR